MKRFRNQEARQLMAFTLAMDPTMSEMLRRMLRMGVNNIYPDYMLVQKEGGCGYEPLPDPSAWMGRINQHVGVMLLRGRDGVWFLNGF